jgi:hypothetical protein
MHVRIPSFIDTRRAESAMVAILVLWVVWFGRLALHRYNGLGFGAFDLGIFDQGLWLLSRFEEPFITLRGLHLFADHASYILILFTPLYWVIPSVNLLIGMATVVPAVAGWLSFRIARVEGLRPWPAFAVGLTVLLAPAMAWTTWDSFHPETFAIALFPASYLAARKGKFTFALVLAALVLLAKEDAGLLVAPYALYMWLRWKEARAHAYVLAALAVGVTALSLLVVLPGFSPTGELIYTGRYPLVIADLMTWPRLGYLAGMLIPAFLAFRAPAILALGIPITVANLASTHGYQHEIMWHYTAYLLGVLAVAVPVGAVRFWHAVEDSSSPGRRFPDGGPGLLGTAVLVSAVCLVTFGPDLVTRHGQWSGLSVSEQTEFNTALATIPPDAVVSATWNITPHLSHRRHIYMAPNPFSQHYWGVQGRYPALHDPSTIEYLVVDTRKGGGEASLVDRLLSEGWTLEVDGTFLVLVNPSPGGTPGTPPPP